MRNYLNIHAPEHEALRGSLTRMRHFFTDPVSLNRGRDPVAMITWERVQLHLLRECPVTFWHPMQVFHLVE